MCGIIAVVRRRADRPPPDPGTVRALLDEALAAPAAAGPLEEADRLLRGVPGVQALLAAPDLVAAVDA
ncbi:MAG: hypothetical protein ACRD0G_10775, partial [Acidimicrobiales bacterium]